MKRGLFIGIIALAVVASSASAVDIMTYGTHTGYQYRLADLGYNVGGISDDGTAIFADIVKKANVINVASGASEYQWSTANLYARGGGKWVGAMGTGGKGPYFVGLGQYPVTNTPSSTGNYGEINNLNTPVAGLLKDKNNVNKTVLAFQNNTSMDYATGDGWMVGRGSTGAANINDGIAWKITAGHTSTMAGAWSANAVWQRTGSYLNGVSNAGIAAVSDTSLGAAYVNLSDGSANVDILPYVGAGTGGNEAKAVSANATTTQGFVGGYFKNTDGTGYRHGFRYDIASGPSTPATELLSIDGVMVTGDETEVFDISNNGIAVGFDRVGSTMTAAVWLPGESQAYSLADIMLEDMPVDGSILNLVTCTSITAVANLNGSGQMVYSIAGQAAMTAGGTRAFVATILPEPTTLAFLVLGGLAMLRRRR